MWDWEGRGRCVRGFMSRIAACICQLSITVTKYLRQDNYEGKRSASLRVLGIHRYSGSVLGGASRLHYVMAVGMRRLYVRVIITSQHRKIKIAGWGHMQAFASTLQ